MFAIRTAIFVGVASVLSVACNRSDGPETGFHMDLASAPEHCGDGRPIVAIAMGNGRARINDDQPFDVNELPATSEVVKMIDAVYPQADVTSILTPKVAALFRERFCLEVSCGLCVNFPSLGKQVRSHP
jgi:hypothetical protein